MNFFIFNSLNSSWPVLIFLPHNDGFVIYRIAGNVNIGNKTGYTADDASGSPALIRRSHPAEENLFVP